MFGRRGNQRAKRPPAGNSHEGSPACGFAVCLGAVLVMPPCLSNGTAAESVPIEAQRPVKLRVFRHGSLLDVFIADRATLTHRLDNHRGGRVRLDFRDTTGCVTNLLARRLD
jgi:hypothetical protein